jgi:hypothetical protein
VQLVGAWRLRPARALGVFGAVLATVQMPATAKMPDVAASLSPIRRGGSGEPHVAYFWLDLQNQAARSQVLCGNPSVTVGFHPGPREPSWFLGESRGPHGACGGLGSEDLVGPGGHLSVGLRMTVTAEMESQKIDTVNVGTGVPVSDSTTLYDAAGPVIIRMEGEQLHRLPRFADLPRISTSRAKQGASFGGWSASVRQVGGDRGPGQKPSYWISLVNERKEGKALCHFLEVRVRLLAHDKEIRTVTEGKVEGNECVDSVGLDSGWRLVGPGEAFTFLFPLEPKAGDDKADRLTFTVRGAESSSKLEEPLSIFGIEAIIASRAK